MNSYARNESLSAMPFECVKLSKVECPLVVKTRAAYQNKLSQSKGRGVYSRYDWARIDHVFDLIQKEGAVLDVGVGAGQLFSALVQSERFTRVVGIDIQRHSNFLDPTGDYELIEMNVTNLRFPDNSFDTVVCMEVLEHLEPQDFYAALNELRRVCRGALILSVPFEEPLPLPPFHKMRFTSQDLLTLFPAADVRLLLRGSQLPWALIIECCAEQHEARAQNENRETQDRPINIDYQDRVSEVYKGELFPKKTQEELRDRVHWMVDQAKGPRILDIGCSQGITSILLAKRGCEVIGVDPEQVVIDYATKDAESHGLSSTSLKFICSTIEDCRHEDLGSFDSILLGEVIEHFENPKEFIRSALRFLKPSGTLVLTTPFGIKPNPDHESTFTLSSIRNLVCDMFTVVELEIVDGYIRLLGVAASLDSAEDGCSTFENMQSSETLLRKTEQALLDSQNALIERIDKQRRARVKVEKELVLREAQLEEISERLKERDREHSHALSELKAKNKKLLSAGIQHEDLLAKALSQKILATHECDRVAYRVGLALVLALKSPLALLLSPLTLFKISLEVAATNFKKVRRAVLKQNVAYQPRELKARFIKLWLANGPRAAYSWFKSARELGLVCSSRSLQEAFEFFADIHPEYAVVIARELVGEGKTFDGLDSRLLELEKRLVFSRKAWPSRELKAVISAAFQGEIPSTQLPHVSFLQDLGLVELAGAEHRERDVVSFIFPADFSERLEEWAKSASGAEVAQVLSALLSLPRINQIFMEAEIFKAFREVDTSIAREYGRRALELKRTPGLARLYSKFLQTLGSLVEVEEIARYLATTSDQYDYHLRVVQSQLALLRDGFPLPAMRKRRELRPSGAPISLYYLLHNSLPYASGGYATRTHGILTSLRSLGIEPTALSRYGYPLDRERNGSELQVSPVDLIDDIPYQRLMAESDKGFGRTPMIPYLNDYCAALERHVKERRVSLLHAASNFMNGVCANYVGRKLGIPTVYEVRGLWEVTRMSRVPEWKNSDYYNMQVRMERDVCLGADRVVTITQALKSELIRRGVPASKITVIPNGADTKRFVPIERDQRLASELNLGSEPVIGYVGSVVQYEGLDLLLNALRLLKSRGKNFKAVIVGDGAVLPSLRSLTSQLNLEQDVIFTGRVSHSEVERYYSLIDICPFPRLGLPVCEMVSPLKPFEAMCMEKLVIASDVAALTEIVKDQHTGLLFRKDNVASLVDTIECALEHVSRGHTLGKNARDWVVGERDWMLLGEKFLAVYKSLLDENFVHSLT